MSRLSSSLVLFGWLAILVGCGADPYELATVRGRVLTCEGKPAAGGQIVFRPIDDSATTGRPKGNPGRESRGVVADDGTFTVETIGIDRHPGAVTGRHYVSFEMPPTRKAVLLPEEKANMTAEEAAKTEAEFAARKAYAPIPCGTQVEPGEVKVAAGENNFEFKLQAK